MKSLIFVAFVAVFCGVIGSAEKESDALMSISCGPCCPEKTETETEKTEVKLPVE